MTIPAVLSKLESLFSLTMWRSGDGYTVGVQQFAGDQVHYETRRTAGEAIGAAVAGLERGALPAPPC